MYRGYPVGYLLLWQNGLGGGHRVIGTDKKQVVPDLLVVDGQQRLTSLHAVLNRQPLVCNYKKQYIKIAFNPLQKEFKVADAAIRRDKAFIANISGLWSGKTDLFDVTDSYLEQLHTTRELSIKEEKLIKKGIGRLSNLTSFPFTALVLWADIDEEQVAEVFVRINSKGITLNQAQFILTFMSVVWDEGRTELEELCRLARKPSEGVARRVNAVFGRAKLFGADMPLSNCPTERLSVVSISDQASQRTQQAGILARTTCKTAHIPHHP